MLTRPGTSAQPVRVPGDSDPARRTGRRRSAGRMLKALSVWLSVAVVAGTLTIVGASPALADDESTSVARVEPVSIPGVDSPPASEEVRVPEGGVPAADNSTTGEVP